MTRRFFFTFGIIASIVILFSAVVTNKREERRVLEVVQKELDEKVAILSKKNEYLRMKNEALVNDPIEIEREAREKHGYIKPGEVTYEKHKFAVKEPKNDVIKKQSLLIRVDSFLFDGPFPWQVPLGLIFTGAIFLMVSYRYERRRLRKKNSN